MSRINAAIEKTMDMIDSLDLFALITRGALGTGDSLSCEIGPTSPSEVYFDKHKFIPIDLTINGKNKDLDTLSEAMNKIHEDLTMRRSYPDGNGWEIVDISTLTEPQVIGREDEGPWLMASALLVKIRTFDYTPATPEPDPDPESDPGNVDPSEE